ncbi:S8 family serine peptidase [Spirosoma taeanense]|uniref:S8 family serine peptidase n=1 Tax=Spirosoma taeanense TaxID=2735870 RepID=A0A6M5YDY0_9BACT|nr:S8 family serine peptidase [Spirosoma taeanense]QJW91503.1 S8 family serine peptidase [Spirosoma taeanense]
MLSLQSCQPVGETVTGSGRQGATNPYIVVLKVDPLSGLSAASPYAKRQQFMRQYAEQMMSRFNIDRNQLGHVYGSCLRGFVAQLTEAQVSFLRQYPDIASIEADQIGSTSVEEAVAGDDMHITAGQEVPWGIKYVGGFIDYTGSNAAYIVDTGIDLTHPDLNVDASRGYNALTTGTGAKSLADNHDHGTHVSGTIAAKNNSIGVVGVAAGAPVIPIKVTEKPENMQVSNVIAGLDFVMANARPGDVINISLGAKASDALDAAVMNLTNRGDLFIAMSAGNTTTNNFDANNISPARINAPNLYSLSAHDSKGVFASVSCSGNPPIDFAGPGVSIKSTVRGGKYTYFSKGTTMATAHASGILLANKGVIYGKGTVTADRDSIPDIKMSRVP